ncbi:MAG: TetR/AcrR family transcriptional regulator [Lachnospiraceae bacterium]|nr:TetR/AcrR family transcriptional regulator [Lachnospiraceae bacterium]
MKEDKKTKEKLTKCAKKEFIEKGYIKASLRNICKEAGVTTGALYFFFKDKEELFDSVVGKPLMELQGAIKEHFSSEDDLEGGLENITPTSLTDDYEAAVKILDVLFRYKEEILLVMNNAQGTRYENIIDEYVNFIYNHYLNLFCKMKGYKDKKQLTDEDRFIVHWMSHDQIDIFIHILTHCKDKEEGARQMKNMFNYMVGGWISAVRKDIIS